MRYLSLLLLPLVGCAHIPRPGEWPKPDEVRLCTEIDLSFIGDLEICPTIPLRWAPVQDRLDERRRRREMDRERRQRFERQRNGEPHSARAIG